MTALASLPVTAPRAGRREWAGLAVLALPTLLVSIDVYVMLLALPRLSADLRASGLQQLWISDIYPLILSGLLVTMGALGDRIGPRRLLLTGSALFGIASVVAAFSGSAAMMIAARALLGVGGATMAPCTLALIQTMFRHPGQRGTAIGIWAMCFSVGAIIGPIAGGAMLDRFWWGSVFLLGVPGIALLLVAGPVLLPGIRSPGARRIDLASAGLSLAAILPAIFGLKELVVGGWDPLPAAALVIGAGAGVLFVRRQRRLADPLLDLRLFASRALRAVLLALLLGTALMAAMMLFVTQYLQLGRGMTPLEAGEWMLPAVAASAASFLLSPLAARRVRPAFVIAAGLMTAVAGLLVIAQAHAASGPQQVAAGFALIFLGGGPLVTLGTALVVGSVPADKAGSAGALNETSGELGFALGLAVLGSIGAAVYHARIASTVPGGLPGKVAAAARDSLAGAAAAAGHMRGGPASALVGAARAAFASELRVVAGLSALLLTGVAVLVIALLRHVPATNQAADGTDEATASGGTSHRPAQQAARLSTGMTAVQEGQR